MSDGNTSGCAMRCWIGAGLLGLLTLIILVALAGYSWGAGIILGLLCAGLLGLLFTWLFCAPVPKMSDRPRTAAASTPTTTTAAGSAIAAAGGAAMASKEPAKPASDPAPATARDGSSDGATAAGTTVSGDASAATDTSRAAATSAATAGGADGDVAENPKVADGAVDGTDTTDATAADTATALADEDQPDAATAGAGSADPAAAEGDEMADLPDEGDSGTANVAKPGGIAQSKRLAGQEELSSRKGSWKYEGGGSGAAAPGDDASADEIRAYEDTEDSAPSEADATGGTSDATENDAAPQPGAAGASEAEARPDADAAPMGAGTKPSGLDAPRDGGADNLKEIKGVGPKLEQMLNDMGFWHFDQIANWSADEVAWVDQNLKGFKGRVTRDNWIEQAQILAAGGETEFSKRVDKGGVY